MGLIIDDQHRYAHRWGGGHDPVNRSDQRRQLRTVASQIVE
jgi:hypothetical protein